MKSSRSCIKTLPAGSWPLSQVAENRTGPCRNGRSDRWADCSQEHSVCQWCLEVLASRMLCVYQFCMQSRRMLWRLPSGTGPPSTPRWKGCMTKDPDKWASTEARWKSKPRCSHEHQRNDITVHLRAGPWWAVEKSGQVWVRTPGAGWEEGLGRVLWEAEAHEYALEPQGPILTFVIFSLQKGASLGFMCYSLTQPKEKGKTALLQYWKLSGNLEEKCRMSLWGNTKQEATCLCWADGKWLSVFP